MPPDNLHGSCSGSRTQRSAMPRGCVLLDAATGGVELPESDIQLSKYRHKIASNARRFRRKDQQSAVREVTVARGLLKASPPILQLGFDGGQLDALPQRNRREFLAVRRVSPGQPQQVRASISVQAELAPCRECASDFLGEVGALKAAQEILLAFPRRGGCSKISPSILGSEANLAWKCWHERGHLIIQARHPPK